MYVSGGWAPGGPRPQPTHQQGSHTSVSSVSLDLLPSPLDLHEGFLESKGRSSMAVGCVYVCVRVCVCVCSGASH